MQADSISNGAVIVLRSGTVTDGMRWKIQFVISGQYYKFVPVSGEYGGYALTGGENCLQQKSYVNTDYNSKWMLHGHKDYALMYIGITAGDEEVLPVLDAVDSALRTDAGMDGYAYSSMTEEELKVHLTSCKIFSCVTHGEQTLIHTSNGGTLTIEAVNALADDAFVDLELVFLGACYTGKNDNGADNLVDALYEKGADVVVGFTVEIDRKEANFWTNVFMESIAMGNTVSQAMSEADGRIYDDDELGKESYYTVYNRRIAGSGLTVPCP